MPWFILVYRLKINILVWHLSLFYWPPSLAFFSVAIPPFAPVFHKCPEVSQMPFSSCHCIWNSLHPEHTTPLTPVFLIWAVPLHPSNLSSDSSALGVVDLHTHLRDLPPVFRPLMRCSSLIEFVSVRLWANLGALPDCPSLMLVANDFENNYLQPCYGQRTLSACLWL